jgi:hypothetical protein
MRASQPFKFETASYLIRIGNYECSNLLELKKGIAVCSDASVFFHTFQSLGRYHFLTEGFSNDFAQWVLASCNRPALAEQLASVDIRDYVSLADLRAALLALLDDYCKANSREAVQAAFEPFYFCETIEEQVPLQLEAWTLDEFQNCMDHLPHASMQFHFITSRLRLHLRTNDFSYWLAKELGEKGLSRQVDQIDIYTNTLDGARAKIIQLVKGELYS